jgi:hypothetical protein
MSLTLPTKRLRYCRELEERKKNLEYSVTSSYKIHLLKIRKKKFSYYLPTISKKEKCKCA